MMNDATIAASPDNTVCEKKTADLITTHIVSLRNRVCPRTSYATSGAAASVICALIVDQNLTSAFDTLAASIRLSKEFEKVAVKNSMSELASEVAGNVILLFGHITSSDVKATAELLSSNRTKLAVFVKPVPSMGLDKLLPNNKFSTCVESLGCFEVMSLYGYTGTAAMGKDVLGFNGQPSVQCKSQFRFLWAKANQAETMGKARVLQRLAEKELQNRGNTKLTPAQWDAIITNALFQENLDDYEIYSLIRQEVFGSTIKEDLDTVINNTDNSTTVTKSKPPSKPMEDVTDGRANHLVSRTIDSIPVNLISRAGAIRTILDYGCAEGAITAALGKQLGVPPSSVLGADVRVIPAEGFTFIPLSAEVSKTPPMLGTILPSIKSHSIDLITAAMVFHHVTHIKAVLLELRRVISPVGALVLREHHCTTADMGAFLDVTHGLYSLSWSSPVEWPDFISEYVAFYRSREQWNELLQQAGFELCVNEAGPRALSNYNFAERAVVPRRDGSFSNTIKAYYAVYRPTPGFILPEISTTNCRKQPRNSLISGSHSINEPIHEISGNRSYKRQCTNDSSENATTGRVDSCKEHRMNEQPRYESRKYPGRYYTVNSVTGATEWIV